MRLYDRIQGLVRVELCGAIPAAAINACAARAIALRDLEAVDACTLRATLAERQLPALEAVAARTMCSVTVLSRRGGSRNLAFLWRRLWLLLTAVLTAGLLLASSLFIWEIQIQGCERLTRGQVLRALADCGVEQGAFWPGISADLVRSRMMLAMPELAWMTVNISGSRASVLLVERVEKPEILPENRAADLVAGRAGIVRSLSVRNGKPLVQPGDTVAAGEILVSGRMDSAVGELRKVWADGRVIADTWYELTSVCPLTCRQKGEVRRQHSCFALKIGKRRINFYRNGKKTLDGYDKIVHEYNMGVEGLFALPLRLVREDLTQRETADAAPAADREMGAALRRDLQERIDGEIVSSAVSVSQGPELVTVTLHAQCRENIARRIEIRESGGSP